MARGGHRITRQENREPDKRRYFRGRKTGSTVFSAGLGGSPGKGLDLMSEGQRLRIIERQVNKALLLCVRCVVGNGYARTHLLLVTARFNVTSPHPHNTFRTHSREAGDTDFDA